MAQNTFNPAARHLVFAARSVILSVGQETPRPPPERNCHERPEPSPHVARLHRAVAGLACSSGDCPLRDPPARVPAHRDPAAADPSAHADTAPEPNPGPLRWTLPAPSTRRACTHCQPPASSPTRLPQPAAPDDADSIASTKLCLSVTECRSTCPTWPTHSAQPVHPSLRKRPRRHWQSLVRSGPARVAHSWTSTRPHWRSWTPCRASVQPPRSGSRRPPIRFDRGPHARQGDRAGDLRQAERAHNGQVKG